MKRVGNGSSLSVDMVFVIVLFFLLLVTSLTLASENGFGINTDQDSHYINEGIYIFISGPRNTEFRVEVLNENEVIVEKKRGKTSSSGLAYIHLSGFSKKGLYSIELSSDKEHVFETLRILDLSDICVNCVTTSTTTTATTSSLISVPGGGPSTTTSAAVETTATTTMFSEETTTAALDIPSTTNPLIGAAENKTVDWAPPGRIRITGRNERGSYGADEEPEFEVELESSGISGLALSTTETLRACLKDSSGNPTEIEPEINRVGDKYQIKIPGKKSIQPGLYNLVVESESHEEEIWFTWGLVSVNTRKSMYHPDETAEILMVVLDKDGYLVSEADVSLTVTSPSEDTSSYSTPDTIKEIHGGIYQVFYQTKEEGNYSLSVTATSTDVTSHIESYFSVRRYYEFDILRETPLTVDPQKGAFESSIHVLSHINVSSFSLREYLPLGFEVVDGGGASVTTKEDAKILTWNLSNNSTVSYRAQAPLIWPYLYQLGPAVINYAENTFKEARPWYLAVDPSTELFFDDFEIDNFATVWTQDAQGSWFRNNQRGYGGSSYSAEVSADSTDAWLKRDAGYNLTSYDYCNLTAYIYIESGVDANEFTCMDYSTDGGTNWNRDTGSPNEAGVHDLCVDGNVDTENTWHYVKLDILGANLTSNFTFRFRATMNTPPEDANVDNVNLTCYTPPPPVLSINLTAPSSDPVITESESFEMNCTVNCTGSDCSNVNVFPIYCSGSPTCTPNLWLNTSSSGLRSDYDNISLGTVNTTAEKIASFNVTGLTSGDYVIACNSTSSNAGNVTSLPVNTSLYVNDPPTAVWTYPSQGEWLHGTENLNASDSTDTDGAITNYLFELDNNTNFDSPSTLCNGADENCTFNTTTQTECEEEGMECYLKLTVTDDDGAQNYTIIQVGVDNTPPTISNERINDTSIDVNEWVCLNVTAQDSLNVSTVIAEIDIPGIESNENLTLFDNGAGCDLTPDDDVYSGEYRSTQSGTYNWTKTYANDTSGNTNTSLPGLTWDVTSDATMTVNMTEPAADLEINQSSPNNRYNQTCSVSCDLGGLDCENVILHAQYNPGTWTDINQSTADLINDENNYSCGNLTAGGLPCSHTFNITSGSSSGNNTWEIRCGASSSNAPQSHSTTVNLTVTDNSGPDSILDQPKANGSITINEFTVNASVTDSGVGVISWVMFEYRTSPSASWQPSCNDTDGTAPFSCIWNLTGLTDSTTYEVRVKANDSLGNLGGYDVHTGITVDRQEPQINLSSPENDSYFTTVNIAFNFTATDNLASTMNCYLYIDSVLNQTNSSTLNNTPTTFYVTGISPGQHTWYINCSDEAGNSNVSETRNFTVDYTPPNWSKQNQIINGQYTDVVHRGDTIKLSAYWADNIGLSRSLLATNETGTWENKTSYGSPKNLTGASGWSNFTWSNSSTALGTKVGWRIYANDTTGNTNLTDVMSFTVWGWAEISGSHLNPAGIKEGESTTMNCRVQDNTTASPIEGYTVYFYNESSFLGTNTTGSDGYATFTFTVNEAGTYTITCNITDNATFYYNVSANNEGVDILGVGYGLSTYSYANTTYHRAYEGVESNTTTQIDDPYTDLESDNNIYQNFTAGSEDYAYTRFEMRIDEEINTVTKINITWIGFGDIGSGTAGYNLSIYNITNQSWMQVASYNTDNTEQTEYIGYSDSFDDIVNSSGYIKILARSYSPAPKTGAGGNRWAEIDTDYIEVKVYYDILPPTVTLSSPEDHHRSPSPVTFNCSVSDDYRISNVTLYGNWSGSWHANETNTSGINNINYSFTKDIGGGVYMWNCRACDRAGNCDFAISNRTLIVDSTPPTIQQQSPISGSYTADTTINFTFIATDNMAEELNCSLYIDNQLKDTNESTKNNTLTMLTATSLSLGGHFWNITCRDKALNQNWSLIRNFTIYEPRTVNITLVNSLGTTFNNTEILIFDNLGQLVSSKTITESDDTLSDELALNQIYAIDTKTPLACGYLRSKIRGINITGNLSITPQVIVNYTGEMPSLIVNVTPLFALNDTGLVYDLAELYIPKNGVNVTGIVHCVQWNFSDAKCYGWEVNDTGDYNMQGNSTHIWFNVTDFTSFGGGKGKPLPNITQIRIYDVTGQADTHSGGTSVGSGLNTTFYFYKREPRVYRVEIDVRNDASTQWTIDSTDIVYHENLNSTWDINTTADVWYYEGDTNYTGGNWSNGRVTWNTSLGGKLTKGETGTFYYVVNITTSGNEKYPVYFLCNDTVDNAGSYDNSIYNITRIGYLEVNLTLPPSIPGQGDAESNGGYKVGQNRTFIINATVYCRDGYCGDLNGTLRYNQSTSLPDTPLNTTAGDKPFYVLSGINPKQCAGNPLYKDEFCSISWEVNSTGNLSTYWKLDVLFNSTYAGSNKTDYTIIEITKVLIMDISWDKVDFGVCNPVTTGNPAIWNNVDGYNISIHPNSNDVDGLWIKGTNLEPESISGFGPITYTIGVGNITWNDLEDNYTGPDTTRLTHNYSLIRENVSSGTAVPMYYWIDLPRGQYAQNYSGTLYILAAANASA